MIARVTLVAAMLCLACDNWVTAQAQPPDRRGPGGPGGPGGPRRSGFPGGGGGPGGPGGPFGPSEPVDWAKRRAELIARFDADQDGTLSASEREQMRRVRFREAYEESGSGRGRGGQMFMMPPEVVKKYDQDGDGRLNDEENMVAANGLRRQMEEITKTFDKNANGRLDPEEQDAVLKDIDAGKLEGVPRFFFMMRGPGRGPGRGGPPGMATGMEMGGAERWKAFDADRDGRLSAVELDAARRAQGGAR